jgi:hypothetical protein
MRILERDGGVRYRKRPMLRAGLSGYSWRQRPAVDDLTRRWLGSIGLALGVGIAYFLAAQLSLRLLTQPDGVAVFWPAAGVSSGGLIALGRGARWPVAAGTSRNHRGQSHGRPQRGGIDRIRIVQRR